MLCWGWCNIGVKVDWSSSSLNLNLKNSIILKSNQILKWEELTIHHFRDMERSKILIYLGVCSWAFICSKAWLTFPLLTVAWNSTHQCSPFGFCFVVCPCVPLINKVACCYEVFIWAFTLTRIYGWPAVAWEESTNPILAGFLGRVGSKSSKKKSFDVQSLNVDALSPLNALWCVLTALISTYWAQ